jgi:predicted aldo/keto reductase-like oxidoreductase
VSQILPQSARIAMLVNRNNPSASLQLKEASDAARMLDRQLDVLDVSDADIYGAFSALTQRGDGAVKRVKFAG